MDDQELLLYWRTLCKLPKIINQPPLTKRQRCAMATRCEGDAPALVRAVANALRQNPEFFPDIPITPAALDDAQGRAVILRIVRDTLVRCLRQVSDAYLVAQNQASAQAMLVLRQVLSPMPFGSPADPLLRALLMCPAVACLRGRRQRRVRSAKRRAAQKSVQAPKGQMPMKSFTSHKLARKQKEH